MTNRLTAIAARVERATGGPWTARRCWERPYGGKPHNGHVPSDGVGQACEIVAPRRVNEYSPTKATFRPRIVSDTNHDECCHMMTEADAAFIAHARDDVPYLLQLVARYREALEAISELGVDHRSTLGQAIVLADKALEDA